MKGMKKEHTLHL